MTGLQYSTAPRCPCCNERAILTVTAANCLVAASGRRLQRFRCPYEHGWHVRHPGVEGGDTTHRRKKR